MIESRHGTADVHVWISKETAIIKVIRNLASSRIHLINQTCIHLWEWQRHGMIDRWLVLLLKLKLGVVLNYLIL